MHQEFPSSATNNGSNKKQRLHELERTMQYLAVSNNDDNNDHNVVAVVEQQEPSSSSSSASSCENGLDGIGRTDSNINGHQQTTPKRGRAQMKKSLHLDLLSISNTSNINNTGFLSSPASATAERLNSGILSPWNQPQFQNRRVRPSKLFPVHIMPYLYLGNDETAKSWETLSNCGIHYVINVTSDLPNYFDEQRQQENEQQHELGTGTDPYGDSSNHIGHKIVYMRIPVDDNCSHNLAQFFPKAIAFIERARSQQLGVLVHCWAGISRSVTICLAYLMYSLRCSLEEAFDRLLKQNGTIAPNFHFMEALTCWERELFASSFSLPTISVCFSPPPSAKNSSSHGHPPNSTHGHPRSPSTFMVGT